MTMPLGVLATCVALFLFSAVPAEAQCRPDGCCLDKRTDTLKCPKPAPAINRPTKGGGCGHSSLCGNNALLASHHAKQTAPPVN